MWDQSRKLDEHFLSGLFTVEAGSDRDLIGVVH